MDRQRLNFVPQWAGPIERFAVRYCLRNRWRTTPDYDLEDLLQEARILFLKCNNKYGAKVTEPAHFMRLFQIALTNRITTLANRRTKYRRSLLDNSRRAGINPADELARVDLADLLTAVKSDPIRRLVEQLITAELKQRRTAQESKAGFVAKIMGVNDKKEAVCLITNWLNGNPNRLLEST